MPPVRGNVELGKEFVHLKKAQVRCRSGSSPGVDETLDYPVRRLPFCPHSNDLTILAITDLDHLLSITGQSPVRVGQTCDSTESIVVLFCEYLERFLTLWLRNDQWSYLALTGLLLLLETGLDTTHQIPAIFEAFAEGTGDHMIEIIRQGLPWLIDAEMLYGYDVVDLLLTNLAVHVITTGRNSLARFIDEVPYFSGFYLRAHQKRFEELFQYIRTNQEVIFDQDKTRIVISPHYLTCMHVHPRKIVVSNAPPVKLRKNSIVRKEKYRCDLSSGGLVSGIKSGLESDDMWVSYLDPTLVGLDRMPPDVAAKIMKESIRIPGCMRRVSSISGQNTSFSSDDSDGIYNQLEDYLWEKTENDWVGLQRRLDAFKDENFTINPLVIMKDDHKAFYNGISNGLLWPAFHNLPQYIVQDYKQAFGDTNPKLFEDWIKYAKVNFHFAIHAARSCRSQDFLWIHDYHLCLVGRVLRSLDPSMKCAFFLHIPFGLSEEFMQQYKMIGCAILQGLLGFKQVGFQTSRDCQNFVDLCQKHIPGSVVNRNSGVEGTAFSVTSSDGWRSNVGAFPISIKIDRFVQFSQSPGVKIRARIMRETIMGPEKEGKTDGKLFVSAERFDYTKGILERLNAIRAYFSHYPDRIGKDTFYQVAASSRSDIDSYRQYQENAMTLAHAIIKELACRAGEESSWTPIVMDQTNHAQNEVVALFLAADVIVVTPVVDGMNLVVKEAIISNPSASFVLSTGAGAESQLYDAGLADCYHRVTDLNDSAGFAGILWAAAFALVAETMERGQRLYDLVVKTDIGHWISSQTHPQWTSNIIQAPSELTNDYSQLLPSVLNDLQKLRGDIVGNLLVSQHVDNSYDISLLNALQVVKSAAQANGYLTMTVAGYDVAVEPDCLINGLQLDSAVLNSIKARHSTEDLVDQLRVLSGIQAKEFYVQVQILELNLQRILPVDSIIFKYEDCFIKPTNPGIAQERVPYFAILQSFTAAFLMTHFGRRYSLQTVLTSDLPTSQLAKCLCTPDNSIKLMSLTGLKDHLDKNDYDDDEDYEMLGIGKRVLVFCAGSQEGRIGDQLGQFGCNPVILPMALGLNPGGARKPGNSLNEISCVEVLMAVMARYIVKPVTIDC